MKSNRSQQFCQTSRKSKIIKLQQSLILKVKEGKLKTFKLSKQIKKNNKNICHGNKNSFVEFRRKPRLMIIIQGMVGVFLIYMIYWILIFLMNLSKELKKQFGMKLESHLKTLIRLLRWNLSLFLIMELFLQHEIKYLTPKWFKVNFLGLVLSRSLALDWRINNWWFRRIVSNRIPAFFWFIILCRLARQSKLVNS